MYSAKPINVEQLHCDPWLIGVRWADPGLWPDYIGSTAESCFLNVQFVAVSRVAGAEHSQRPLCILDSVCPEGSK